jgi:hypothetical protein
MILNFNHILHLHRELSACVCHLHSIYNCEMWWNASNEKYKKSKLTWYWARLVGNWCTRLPSFLYLELRPMRGRIVRIWASIDDVFFWVSKCKLIPFFSCLSINHQDRMDKEHSNQSKCWSLFRSCQIFSLI